MSSPLRPPGIAPPAAPARHRCRIATPHHLHRNRCLAAAVSAVATTTPDLKRISLLIIFPLTGSLILNLVLFIRVLAVRPRGPSPALPTCPEVFCPNGWVGYQGKCYYFAKAEGNWTSSKMHCCSLNATLAVVDSQEEMDFMMRYKGPADHWVGLHRNQSQPWKWINGTIFSEWFTILGGGSCAYMNQQGIASSSCSREEPWICSKPVAR
ncbi:PREDICTED: C-type lectin domain family 2 member D-like [Gekko japonicus]|uniref:C-type lectin domain family 2 member D-like n=1 Tax=Gekko japonicus TaxID=146911 RepID=A0ABM1K9K8_GEKJA|nr:PREDICTED: C-type lectin domain family 2 member D-like [Gekko japonicus]